jgi:mono/diheme cytochrome c family protein
MTMKASWLPLAAALVAGVAGIAATKPAPAPPVPSYSSDQAQRGQIEYYENCAECHGAEAQGHIGPALVGDDGNLQWETVQYVYQFTTAQMPVGNAGALPKSTYLDIMAFLMKAHGNPPGEKPLTDAVANASQATFERP